MKKRYRQRTTVRERGSPGELTFVFLRVYSVQKAFPGPAQWFLGQSIKNLVKS